MRYCHFTLEGENIQEKFNNMLLTRYPEHKTTVNNSIICLKETMTRHNGWMAELIVIINFSFNGNENAVQVMIAEQSGHIHKNKIPREYDYYKKWGNKWGLVVSRANQGWPN